MFHPVFDVIPRRLLNDETNVMLLNPQSMRFMVLLYGFLPIALHPNAGGATRNAAVYTPVSAILHHAGVDLKLRRPKGAKGRIVSDWLRPDDANAIIVAADQISAEFGTLLRALLYTGLRLGEVLAWTWDDLHLDEGAAWTRREKGGIESDARLRPDLVAALRLLRPTDGQGRVFRYHQGGTPQAPADARQVGRARSALSCPSSDRLAASGQSFVLG